MTSTRNHWTVMKGHPAHLGPGFAYDTREVDGGLEGIVYFGKPDDLRRVSGETCGAPAIVAAVTRFLTEDSEDARELFACAPTGFVLIWSPDGTTERATVEEYWARFRPDWTALPWRALRPSA